MNVGNPIQRTLLKKQDTEWLEVGILARVDWAVSLFARVQLAPERDKVHVCASVCLCVHVCTCLAGNWEDGLLTRTDSLLGNRHCVRQYGVAFKSRRL